MHDCHRGLIPRRWLLAALSLAMCGTASVGAQESAGFQQLDPGERVTGAIDWAEGWTYNTYLLKVPASTLSVRLVLGGASVDLDLMVKLGEEILDYSEVDFTSASDDFNEELVMSRFGTPALLSGVYYIDVAYQLEGAADCRWDGTTADPLSTDR